MKKFVALLLTLALGLLLVGCNTSGSGNENSDPNGGETAVTINAAVLKGPTAIGMVSMMDKAKNGKTKGSYDFQIFTAPDQVTAALLKGELDIACLPTNAAATLYQKSKAQGKEVQIAAINTLGVLYLVEKGEAVAEIKDLKGKKIVSAGKGSTPQYVIEHLISAAGLKLGEDVTVDYVTDHAECLSLLMAGNYDLALLPEPFVTNAKNKNDKIRVALDCNKLWSDAHDGSELVMGSVVVRAAFAKEHPEAVKTFLEEFVKSAVFANEQVAETAALCASFEIMEEAVAKKAIPNCAITAIMGQEMKTMTAEFLQVLFDANAQAVGGEMPDDAFYWIAA